MRKIDDVALERTVTALDYMPASQVRQIVEHYTREQWLTELRKNPRVLLLTQLAVGGRGVPWTWGVKGRTPPCPSPGGRRTPKLYVQSVDRSRAQALLGDPDAKWEIYNPPRGLGKTSTPYVRRVR